jgi:hypothetical protein
MTTLVSLDVSRRRKEKEELKQLQKYEMGLKQTNLSQNLSDKSTSAFNDKHIYSAMNKVNQSDETIDENLSRISGTFFWNRNIPIKKNPSRGMALEQTIKELTLKSDLNDENDFQNTIDAEKLITKYGSPDHLKVMMNIKNKHDELGQLGVRDRKIRDGLYQKYLKDLENKNVMDTTKDVMDISVSEETSWNKICNQLGKSRLDEGVSRRWTGALRNTGISNSKTRILNLQRSSQYD